MGVDYLYNIVYDIHGRRRSYHLKDEAQTVQKGKRQKVKVRTKLIITGVAYIAFMISAVIVDEYGFILYRPGDYTVYSLEYEKFYDYTLEGPKTRSYKEYIESLVEETTKHEDEGDASSPHMMLSHYKYRQKLGKRIKYLEYLGIFLMLLAILGLWYSSRIFVFFVVACGIIQVVMVCAVIRFSVEITEYQTKIMALNHKADWGYGYSYYVKIFVVVTWILISLSICRSMTKLKLQKNSTD